MAQTQEELKFALREITNGVKEAREALAVGTDPAVVAEHLGQLRLALEETCGAIDNIVIVVESESKLDDATVARIQRHIESELDR